MLRRLMVVLALLSGCAIPQRDFTALVKQEAPAVVQIGAYSASTTREESDAPKDDVEDLLGRLLGSDAAPALGSGFIISEDGYIVTNAHLVAEAASGGVIVRLADRRDYRAKLVGADAVSDIALLKIDARGLPRARLGSARTVQPGQWVAAIGSPLGLEQTLTAGIVSAVDRTLPEESYLPFIQTDVAVNPGNSGGPLFNMRGEVIGVNTVIYSTTGGFMGVSFAVPIDAAMDVVRELQASGKVTRGRIGVRLQELTDELARALGVRGAVGALIAEVLPSGPAEAAGLRAGDVIVAFGKDAVASHLELMRRVATTAPGTSVATTYVRYGHTESTRLRVGEARSASVPESRAALLHDPLGLLVVPLRRERGERQGAEEGVLVHHTEGEAARAGLQPGDIILAVNGVPVATPYGFHERVRGAGKGASIALLVERAGARSFVALRLPD